MKEWTQEGYQRALRFAAEAHGAQTVPGTTLPYLLHVTSVTMEIIAALRVEPEHDQELTVQCALLHDVVEDTDRPDVELRAVFGPAVADGVSALSKDKVLSKEKRLPDSLRRIQAQPPEIWMVKLADRIVNLQPPPAHWSAAKVEAYRAEAALIHDCLKGASPFLATRLQQKIKTYGRG